MLITLVLDPRRFSSVRQPRGHINTVCLEYGAEKRCRDRLCNYNQTQASEILAAFVASILAYKHWSWLRGLQLLRTSCRQYLQISQD